MIRGDTVGLHPELLRRLDQAANDPRLRQRVWVRSGMRTHAEQVVLWNRYLRDGWPKAARPGTSPHEQKADGYGYAADLDFSPYADEWELLEDVCGDYGLIRTVRTGGPDGHGEWWHYQLSGNAPPALPPGGNHIPGEDLDVSAEGQAIMSRLDRIELQLADTRAAAKDASAVARTMWARNFAGGSLAWLDERTSPLRKAADHLQDAVKTVNQKLDRLKRADGG